MAARRGATFEIGDGSDDHDDSRSDDQLTGPGEQKKRLDTLRDQQSLLKRPVVGVGVVALVLLLFWLAKGGTPAPDPSRLTLVTWNVAAINNNPFEYWITHDDPEYNELMKDVQGFIDEPGAADVAVSTVFTPARVAELKALMAKEGFPQVDEAAAEWEASYAGRKIIKEFIKDGALGKKRLVSMPDRITNTINLKGGSAAHRPTVINCYQKSFKNADDWWAQWKAFMFAKELSLANGKTARPCELVGPISRAKYPALTEREEPMSKALSLLAQAAFDAILVHMLETAGDGRHAAKWQPLRKQMCTALNSKKNERTMGILESKHYASADVIFLQEVSGAFVSAMRKSSLGARYEVFMASTSDGKRDQNSVVLLRKDRFDVAGAKDQTAAFDAAIAAQGKDVPIAPGDVAVVAAKETVGAGARYTLASFHGDTNGLATVPVVKAMAAALKGEALKGSTLLFGLDANTYQAGDAHKQDVLKFASEYLTLGLTSCWGDTPDPKNHTTFNARTYLQPQLNKAVKLADIGSSSAGDKNPKDFILFPKGPLEVVATRKDNTGRGEYVEQMVFPTLQFPSDHGILMTVLAKKE